LTADRSTLRFDPEQRATIRQRATGSEREGTNDDWLDTQIEMQWSVPGPEDGASMLADAGFEVRWRRAVDDEMSQKTGFVPGQKPE
jgi:hypothetical protein